MKTTLIATLALACASACATHKINYTNPTVQASGTSQTAKQSFFLWGLVGGSEVDLVKLCPAGVSKIESKTGVGDQILTMITGGLYSPMSVDVRCAAAVGGAQ